MVDIQTVVMTNLEVVKFSDGSAYVYQLSGGVYTAANTRNTLVKNADGSFTLTDTNRTSYTFNANGYLTSIKEKNSNTVNITVDANGNVQSVTDTAGRVYYIARNSNGYISTITDPICRTISFGYSNGELVSVTDPMNVVTSQYSYDSAGYLNKIKNIASNIIWSATYDDNADANQGRLLSTTDADGEYDYILL